MSALDRWAGFAAGWSLGNFSLGCVWALQHEHLRAAWSFTGAALALPFWVAFWWNWWKRFRK